MPIAAATILLIDDEPATRDVVGELLQLEGFSVTAASSAKVALKFLENGGEPDVILLDLRMAGMSGIDFLLDLSSRHLARSSRIVILSGESLAPPFPDSLRRVSRILRKPISAEILVPALHHEALGRVPGAPAICEHCGSPAAWETNHQGDPSGRVRRFCEDHLATTRGSRTVRSFARLGA